MFDRFRDRAARAAMPPLPDFEVMALDPGDWPGGVARGRRARPDGTCRGVALRYDLVGGSGPVYALVHERPDASDATDATEATGATGATGAPDGAPAGEQGGVPAAVVLLL